MLKQSILVCASLTIVVAELYAVKGDKDVTIKLPKVDNMSDRAFAKALYNAGLKADNQAASIHFDRAKDPVEVLSLPISFFESTLTTQQVGEIVLNKNLRTIVNGKVLADAEEENKLAWKHKVNSFRLKLGLINIDTAGDKVDAIIRRIPTGLYQFLSPLTALISPKFKPTLKGFARLFCISVTFVDDLGVDLQVAVQKVLRDLVRLQNSPNRVFAVTQTVIELLQENPALGSTLSSRVAQLSRELHNLSQTLSSKALMAQKAAAHYKNLEAINAVGSMASHAARRAAQHGLGRKRGTKRSHNDEWIIV